MKLTSDVNKKLGDLEPNCEKSLPRDNKKLRKAIGYSGVDDRRNQGILKIMLCQFEKWTGKRRT